jgi:hypothetical protein
MIVASVLLTSQITLAAPQPPLANAVILIIRHAEKQPDGEDLTPAGLARAQAYIRYFENFKIDGAVRKPDYLIAAADSMKSQRTRLTITPLSGAMNLPIDLKYHNKHVDELVQALVSQPTGKTILICWHHEQIANLLTALGADPSKLIPNGTWPEDVYDWLIELRYDSKGNLIPTECIKINEHLMPGDS